MSNIYGNILSEVHQSHSSRAHLFKSIQEDFGGRTLVTFFTSFNYPIDISDEDCDILQSILQNTDCSNGLILMINSPGGNGLTAERIVNTCSAYSGTGDYWVLVPGKAKSAATIVCMGASKIMMSSASELGPVDPQILKSENGALKAFSAHNLVTGYEKLFTEVETTSGRIEPYLQQLAYYDDREITHYRSLIKLAENISVKNLKRSMMKKFTEDQIKKKIDVFLNPDAGTISHGRPIYQEEAKSCGLNIENIDINSKEWDLIYQLYCRTEWCVSNIASKSIETIEESYHVPRN